MVVWKLKSCPRCTDGDLLIDRGYDNWYEQCLQCGYSKDLRVIKNSQPSNLELTTQKDKELTPEQLSIWNVLSKEGRLLAATTISKQIEYGSKEISRLAELMVTKGILYSNKIKGEEEMIIKYGIALDGKDLNLTGIYDNQPTSNNETTQQLSIEPEEQTDEDIGALVREQNI